MMAKKKVKKSDYFAYVCPYVLLTLGCITFMGMRFTGDFSWWPVSAMGFCGFGLIKSFEMVLRRL